MKFTMTREQNVFLANRNMAEYIFNCAKLEGCNLTLAETQMILKGENVGHVSLEDIQRILNLRGAWSYMLANFNSEFDVDYICKVNILVFRNENFEGGRIRTKKAKTLAGTSYVPTIPVKAEIVSEISRLLNLEDAAESAVKLFLWMYRAQLFLDGNKRTGMICANRRLIESGAGILTVKDTKTKEFNKLIVNYYETGDPSMEQWLYDNCIVGLN